LPFSNLCAQATEQRVNADSKELSFELERSGYSDRVITDVDFSLLTNTERASASFINIHHQVLRREEWSAKTERTFAEVLETDGWARTTSLWTGASVFEIAVL
jgi:hypothetical protein